MGTHGSDTINREQAMRAVQVQKLIELVQAADRAILTAWCNVPVAELNDVLHRPVDLARLRRTLQQIDVALQAFERAQAALREMREFLAELNQKPQGR